MVNAVDIPPTKAKLKNPPDAALADGVDSASRVGISMSRTVVNFLLDALLLAVLTAVIAVGLVVEFVFPPGTNAAGWTLWGLSYNAWSRLQFGLVSVLTLGVLVHVMLHWTWVCGVVVSKLLRRKRQPAPDDGIRTLYGVATLIVLLTVIGVVVAAANLAVQSGPVSPS